MRAILFLGQEFFFCGLPLCTNFFFCYFALHVFLGVFFPPSITFLMVCPWEQQRGGTERQIAFFNILGSFFFFHFPVWLKSNSVTKLPTFSGHGFMDFFRS